MMMRAKFFVPLIAAFTIATSLLAQETPGGTQQLLVVMNTTVTKKEISVEDLKNIYLGKTSFWPDNTSIKAFDRPVDRPAGQSFYRDVLKMVPARFRHHWQGQQLAGRGIAPETLATVDDVVARVASTAGAVSYVHASEVPKTGLKNVITVSITEPKP